MQEHWSWDIDDPDAFVGRVISRTSLDLDHHRRERLHQFLLIALWELSRIYRKGGVTFSTVAGNTLPKRVIDWERTPEEGGRTKWQFSGHTYERALPHFTTLDDRPEQADDSSPVDAGLYSDAAARRVLRARGSEQAGHDNQAPTSTTSRAA